jgi:hypothetical protein
MKRQVDEGRYCDFVNLWSVIIESWGEDGLSQLSNVA